MKKAHNNKAGSTNTLKANQIYKNRKNRNRSTSEKLLPKTKKLLESSDSPYKNSLSEIKQINLKQDDSDDFKTPIPIRKTVKLCKPQISKSKKNHSNLTRQTTKQQKLILKTIEDNFENLDMNSENLQMALALSKSTFQTENSVTQNEEDLTISSNLSTSSNLGSVWERFRFKSNKYKRVSSKSKITFMGEADSREVNKKRKNSKFHYVTPTLITRTEDDREALITTKISFILNHIESSVDSVRENPVSEIFSERIKDYYNSKNKLITLNLLTHSALQEEIYFVKSLNLLISKSNCGCLLKKLEDIPGRDKTPNRVCNRNTEINEDNKSASTDETDKISKEVTLKHESCASPDLFDSDSESFSVQTSRYNMGCSANINHGSEVNMALSTVFKSNSDIEHFESVCDDSSIMSKQITLLTQSSKEGEILASYSKTPYTKLDSLHFDKAVNINNSVNNNFEDALNGLGQNDTSLFSSYSSNRSTYLTEKTNATADVIKNNSQNNNNFLVNKNKIDSNVDNLVNDRNEMNESKINSVTSDIPRMSIDTDVFSLQNINEINKQESTFEDTKNEVSHRISLNDVENLNVTDYLNELLNKRNSVFNDMEERQKESSNEQLPDGLDVLSQSTSSQERIIISDEELNYSSRNSKNIKNRQFYDLCSSNEEMEGKVNEDIQEVHTNLKTKYSQNTVALVPGQSSSQGEGLSQNSENITKESVTQKKCYIRLPEIINEDHSFQIALPTNIVTTPKPNLIIKTNDTTPMANYDEMSSPQIKMELGKFGLKPLKRQRGIQLLKYIYETTHPFVDIETDENSTRNEELIKRKKIEDNENELCKRCHLEPSQSCSVLNIVGDSLLQNEKNEDLILEKRISKRMPSCAVPLQIVWYNFVNSNPELKKNIILYEPLQLEVIHSMLRDQTGCKFKLEDLINFLDKKCITFRTSQWQKQRNKEYLS